MFWPLGILALVLEISNFHRQDTKVYVLDRVGWGFWLLWGVLGLLGGMEGLVHHILLYFVGGGASYIWVLNVFYYYLTVALIIHSI